MSPAVEARAVLAPNASSVERMALIDALPPAWRAMANEYGAEIVKAILEDDAATDPQEAADALLVYRETRQQALLATTHRASRPRTAKAIADATVRRAQARGNVPAAPRLVEAEAGEAGAHLFNDLGL